MNNIKILENGMIKIYGDYRNFYNKDNDTIDNTCPVGFENCELLEIDEECMILEPESDWAVTIDDIIYGKDDFREEINIDLMIEHLQEMGKVEIGNCDIEELQESLEKRGYITEIDNKDREYLTLIDTIISLEKICEDLLYTEVEYGEIENNIIEQFGNYQFKGESKIIVSESQISGYDYIAYADHKEAPQVGVKIEDNKIIKAEII